MTFLYVFHAYWALTLTNLTLNRKVKTEFLDWTSRALWQQTTGACPLPAVLPQGWGDVHSHPWTTKAPSPGHWVSKMPAQLEISKDGFGFSIHFLNLLGRWSLYGISRQKRKIYSGFCKNMYERAPTGCSACPQNAWQEVLRGSSPAWWTHLTFSTCRHEKELVQPVNHFIYFLL